MRPLSGLANHSAFHAMTLPTRRAPSRPILAFGAGLAALIATASATLAQSPEAPTAAGFWQSDFDDGTPSGWFHFVDHDGVFEGRLVKMFPKPGETAVVKTCTKCEGERKNAPMLGMVIVWGMKHHGAKYEDGSILDPRDGTVYSAQMEVSPDGQKLFVRGYLGISLLGQTKTWSRLPDDAIPADAIPGETLATAPPKKKPAVPAKTAPAPDKAPVPDKSRSTLETPPAAR